MTLAQEAGRVDAALLPRPFRVVDRRHETNDVVTLALEPVDGEGFGFEPGQFNMLTATAIGESAISISSAPGAARIEHTIRAVGPVTRALCELQPGFVVGLRGPFGNGWGAPSLAGRDVVVVAGGIGLAPLRGVVRTLVEELHAGRNGAGSLHLLVGARSPDQIVFLDELASWRAAGARVALTVDIAGRDWDGEVGVVTGLIPRAEFDPARTSALICGPEVMIRFTARALVDRGVGNDQILISLERNMQCGVGICGHCQLGPLLVCRDGPVVSWIRAERLLMVREL